MSRKRVPKGLFVSGGGWRFKKRGGSKVWGGIGIWRAMFKRSRRSAILRRRMGGPQNPYKRARRRLEVKSRGMGGVILVELA